MLTSLNISTVCRRLKIPYMLLMLSRFLQILQYTMQFMYFKMPGTTRYFDSEKITNILWHICIENNGIKLLTFFTFYWTDILFSQVFFMISMQVKSHILLEYLKNA